LSRAAKASLFQRSLFERFVSLGARPVLLSVQYRMHPEIRAWPSREFYDDRLTDSDSVRARAALDFVRGDDSRSAPKNAEYASGNHDAYSAHIREPYVLFDVKHGSHTANTRSGSLANPAEALFAACLYAATRRLKTEPGAEPPTCAIVTPYREQRACILKAFALLFGGAGAAGRLGVRVSTVDGFQGQEADVIIFSTVRGSRSSLKRGAGGGGIGFLADVRRVNVALTRAKRALWIVGKCDVLRNGSEVWGRLVEDAERRGAVARDADSFAMFDAIVQRETQARALRALGGGGIEPVRAAAGDRTRDAFGAESGWGRAAESSHGAAGGTSRARTANDVYGDLDDTYQ
jgi:senataxin